MGNWASVADVRDTTGYQANLAPSGTVNNAIKKAESILPLYIGETPAYATGSKFWVNMVATEFSAHFLCMRLATQNAPGTMYAQGMKQNRRADWGGYAIMAEQHWDAAIRVLDMHGRNINITRVTPG
jgi:hypothetical protein